MGNDYDKIFKENFEALLLSLAEKLLDLDFDTSEDLPNDLHRTIERKPDFLKKIITDSASEDYILHLEFQTANHPEMHLRMYEYHGLLLRKYQLEVRQYVIYLGMQQMNMQASIEYSDLSYQFRIIDLKQIPYKEFLSGHTAEEILLAILGDFGSDSLEDVLRNILRSLKSKNLETLDRQKYVIQLEILSRLRNLQELIVKQIPKIMAIDLDPKEDLRYKQGKEAGKIEGIKKALQNGKFNLEDIAEIFDVDEAFILKIKAELK